MLPLGIPNFIQHSLQSSLLPHHIPHDLAYIPLQNDFTPPGQPPEDVERICVHTRRVRHAPIIGQTRLQNELERHQPPAVPQP